MKKLLMIASIGCIIGVGSLSAGTISFTGTLADTLIPSSLGTSTSLSGFNLVGQTLTGVTVTLNSFSGNIQEFINNTSGTPQAYTSATQFSVFQLLGPPSPSTPVTQLGSNLNESCGPLAGTAAAGLTHLTACGFLAVSGVVVNPGDLADYLAPTVSFNINDISDLIGGQTSSAPPNSVSFGAGGDFQGQITVQYTYSATSTTPEPATLFLMGSALVGCGLLRKRIKS